MIIRIKATDTESLCLRFSLNGYYITYPRLWAFFHFVEPYLHNIRVEENEGIYVIDDSLIRGICVIDAEVTGAPKESVTWTIE